MNEADTSCPKCGNTLITADSICPICDSSSNSQVRRKQDADYLAQDSWSFSDSAAKARGTDEPAQAVSSDRPAAGELKGVGYQGHDQVQQFKQTVGIGGTLPLAKLTPEAKAAKAAETSKLPELSSTPADGAHKATLNRFVIDRSKLTPASTDAAPIREIASEDDSTAARYFIVWLTGCAVALIALWWVPETVGEEIVLPFDLIKTTHGAQLISLLVGPMTGTILIALVLAPIVMRLKAKIALPLSFVALSIPLVLNTQSLALAGPVVLVTASFAIAAAVVAFVWLESRLVGHVVLSLLPLALLGAVFFGIATNQHSAGYVTTIKEPLEIYVVMIATAVSADFLLHTRRATLD